MTNIITQHQQYEPPTGNQIFLLTEAVQVAIIQHASRIKVIRKNARPVMIEDSTLEDNRIIQLLQHEYNIPAHIIAEVVANAQMIGFLDGSLITVSSETLQSHKEKTQQELIQNFIVPYRVTTPSTISQSDINALHVFFSQLAKTTLIQTLEKEAITRTQMPRGIIRQISLFDMDYKNTFQNLHERLSFILLNIIEQDRLFGDLYAIMIQENGGLPVDDIIGKETTMLSPDNFFGHICTLDYKGQKINALMRIIPGFSPVGLDIMAGLDLPGGNQNYFATIGVQFNTYEGVTTPVIHTLQLSTHNIGSTPEGQLIGIKEPYDQNTVTMKERMRIINAFAESIYDFDGLRTKLASVVEAGIPGEMIEYIDNNTRKALQGKYSIIQGDIHLLGTPQDRRKLKDTVVQGIIEGLKNDAIIPLLASTITYLFSHGYTQVIIQNPEKNLRLQQHNQQRSEESIISSGINLYNKKALQLGGIQNDKGDYSITPASFMEAHKIPYNGLEYMNIEGLLQAKNNVFPTNHPAQTSSFNIQQSTDRALLEIFIQSQYYNAY